MGPQPGNFDWTPVEAPYGLARLVVAVAGVAGFLGLLVAALHAGGAQTLLRIGAFVWFGGFGVLHVVLDARARRALQARRRSNPVFWPGRR